MKGNKTMTKTNPANEAHEILTQEDVYAICQEFPQIEGASRRFSIIRRLNRLSAAVEAIKNGATLMKLKRMKVYQDIVKMKFSIPNDDLSGLDKIEARLERAMDQMEALHA